MALSGIGIKGTLRLGSYVSINALNLDLMGPLDLSIYLDIRGVLSVLSTILLVVAYLYITCLIRVFTNKRLATGKSKC